ncbi:MAG TPA: ketoacyl-ACP synthase III [Thermoanaerobaculia bacterium]|nr:ketoacyl-ACP synthase III [Thermoanaerobaculia bacterium]
MKRAYVQATAWHVPEGELTNDDLARELGDWTAEKIFDKTGIRTRHIAAPDECASDLGVAAAEKLFALDGCNREDVDYLIFCTQSPDYFMPSSSCVIQDRLGLRKNIAAVDVGQGCSGWVYGLSLAKSLVEAEVAQRVLLITADTHSKVVGPRDRSVRTIFGDGAAATLIGGTGHDAQQELVGPFLFGTDGSACKTILIPAGGYRQPMTDAARIAREDKGGNWRSDANMYMDGPEVFNFTLNVVPRTVQQLLEKSGMTLEQVDYFIFHQANRFILDRLRAKIGIAPERFCIDMDWCGNTSSSTIPIAFNRAVESGTIRSGMNVMAVAFGVGLSWAAAMIRVP